MPPLFASVSEGSDQDDGRTPLHVAAEKGRAQVVRSLLATIAVDSLTDRGWSALHFAARAGHSDVVRELIRANAVMHLKTHTEEYTALHLACTGKSNDTTVGLLVASGAIVSETNKDGMTALHIATKCGHVHLMNILIQHTNHGIVTAACNGGKTALHVAAESGQIDAAKLLVSSPQIVVDAQTTAGWTVLHCVCGAQTWSSNHTAMLRSLINLFEARSKKSVFDFEDAEKRTTLHLAALFGRVDAVKALLSAKAATAVQDFDGNAPIHLACESGNAAVVKLLIQADPASFLFTNAVGNAAIHVAVEQGQTAAVRELLSFRSADVNAPGPKMKSPLHIAAEAGFTDIVALLTSKFRADPNARAENADTPLILAARRGHEKTCAALLSNGADVNASNTCLQTPLHAATEMNRTSTALFLIRSRADVNAVTTLNQTALHWAARNCNTEVMTQLISAGATAQTRELEHGETALFWAVRGSDNAAVARRESCETLDRLSNASTTTPSSPIASSDPQMNSVRLLLKSGATVTIPPWTRGSHLMNTNAHSPFPNHQQQSPNANGVQHHTNGAGLRASPLQTDSGEGAVPSLTMNPHASPLGASSHVSSGSGDCCSRGQMPPMSALALAVEMENEPVARLLFGAEFLQSQHKIPLRSLPFAMASLFRSTVECGTQHDAPAQTDVSAAAAATAEVSAAERRLLQQDKDVQRLIDEFRSAERRFTAAMAEGCATDCDAANAQTARGTLVATAEALLNVSPDSTPFNTILSDAVAKFRVHERRVIDRSSRITMKSALFFEAHVDVKTQAHESHPRERQQSQQNGCHIQRNEKESSHGASPGGQDQSRDQLQSSSQGSNTREQRDLCTPTSTAAMTSTAESAPAAVAASPLLETARCADELATLAADEQVVLLALASNVDTAERSFNAAQWRADLEAARAAATMAKCMHERWCEPGGLSRAGQLLAQNEAATHTALRCRREADTADSKYNHRLPHESEASLRVARDAAHAALATALDAGQRADAAVRVINLLFPRLRTPGPNEGTVVEDAVAACRAASNGDTAAVERIVTCNWSALQHPDADGMTPLHHAAANGHLETVRSLVTLGATVMLENLAGKLPVELAFNANHEAVSSFLIRQQAGVGGHSGAAASRHLDANDGQSEGGAAMSLQDRLTVGMAGVNYRNVSDAGSVLGRQSSMDQNFDEDCVDDLEM